MAIKFAAKDQSPTPIVKKRAAEPAGLDNEAAVAEAQAGSGAGTDLFQTETMTPPRKGNKK